MCEMVFPKSDGIEKDLIVKEFEQRYNQYRWEDETRAKFINFYIIFYIALWGLIGFLSEHEKFLQILPYGDCPYQQYALIFLFAAILGTFWLISVISFRSIQILEGRAINDIKELAPYLKNNVRYPSDRRIWKTHKLIYSTTPLVVIIFLLNEVGFGLSMYLFQSSGIPYYKSITFYINILAIIAIVVYARYWRPKASSIKDLDFEKIW